MATEIRYNEKVRKDYDKQIELAKLALEMAEWKDKNPSDKTIMHILNCIGYEEDSWIEFVRKRLENI